MSDHPAPAPALAPASAPAPAPSESSPAPKECRLQLNNWLQDRGWRGRLECEILNNGTPRNPTWSAIYRFDGMVYGKGEGGKKGIAKEEAARRALRGLVIEEVLRLVKRRVDQSTP